MQLDQSNRRLGQLEDDKKNSEQSLKRTQGLLDDLKGKAVALMKIIQFNILLIYFWPNI